MYINCLVVIKHSLCIVVCLTIILKLIFYPIMKVGDIMKIKNDTRHMQTRKLFKVMNYKECLDGFVVEYGIAFAKTLLTMSF